MLMNRKVQTATFKSVMPALALGAVLMLLGPTAALAQRGGGAHGGHSGASSSGRSFSGGGGHSYSARPIRAVAILAVCAAIRPATGAAAIPVVCAAMRPLTRAVATGGGYSRWSRRLLPWPVLRRTRLLLRWTLPGSSSTLASGSASRSAGATIRVPAAAITTDTVTGNQPLAIRTSIPATDRIAA